MHIQQQGSLLSGFHLNSRRNQTRQKQAQDYPDGQSSGRHQNNQILLGLCNFFWTHIKEFAVIAALLFKLTWKDYGYKGGPLPETAMGAFINCRKQLILEPVMAFPRTDCQYALITDAATGTPETPGGLGAILTQVDKDGKFYAILFASRQLKDHKKLLTIPAGGCSRCLGDGSLQRVPQRQEVHPLHGSQTTGEARSSA